MRFTSTRQGSRRFETGCWNSGICSKPRRPSITIVHTGHGSRGVTGFRATRIPVPSDAKETDPSLRRLALSFVLLPGLLPLLAGCNQGYSPNTYASSAAQDEANVERGMIIGVRQVTIAASGTVGAATGGAAGGVAGAQLSGGPVTTALGAIGGTLVGGIGGTAAAQAIANTKGWEYIVQEDGNKLVSVTQTSKMPLPVGMPCMSWSSPTRSRPGSCRTTPCKPQRRRPRMPGRPAQPKPARRPVQQPPRSISARCRRPPMRRSHRSPRYRGKRSRSLTGAKPGFRSRRDTLVTCCHVQPSDSTSCGKQRKSHHGNAVYRTLGHADPKRTSRTDLHTAGKCFPFGPMRARPF